MTDQHIDWLVNVFWVLLVLAFVIWAVTRLPMFKTEKAPIDVAPKVPSLRAPRVAEPRDPVCACCQKNPPTMKMPKQKHRRRDHVWNPHAEQNYGLPPRAMVGVDPNAPDELCAGCEPVVRNGLEGFLAKQYAKRVEGIAEQAKEAAAFEAHGMINDARLALKLITADPVPEKEELSS